MRAVPSFDEHIIMLFTRSYFLRLKKTNDKLVNDLSLIPKDTSTLNSPETLNFETLNLKPQTLKPKP